MLHLFRRNGAQDGAPIERPDGSIVGSHILGKLLKRLRQMERPHLLDLGRLSGSNIEFFARHGCKVQVEDLLLPIDEEQAQGATQESRGADSPLRTPAADDRPAGGGLLIAPEAPAATATRTGGTPGVVPGGLQAETEPPVPRTGARPSRRIVLPPRRFSSALSHPRPAGPEARPRPGAQVPAAAKNALLPTKFTFPDETFDAIVAWDIFNYYHPGAMTLLAAEARRILKPGGLLLGYFHARRPEGSETPRRYRILDERRVACDGQPGPPLQRHVYQNRDIEKMFLGLSIVELYFLKNATRELLMEKKTPRPPLARSPIRPASPKPRFTIE